MQRGLGRVEDLLPAVRALIARQLVEKRGLKSKAVAETLNLTPAAVSLYLSGERANRVARQIERSPQASAIISDLAQRIGEGIVAPGLVGVQITEASYQILSVLRGAPTPKPAEAVLAPDEVRRLGPLIELLRQRIEAEQRAAQVSMTLAANVRGELTRLLFRQIASDSLRHADISSALLSHLQSGLATGERLPSEKELESIVRLEEGSYEVPLTDLKKLNNPLIDTLVASIEADEEKHSNLLKRLLEAIKSGR